MTKKLPLDEYHIEVSKQNIRNLLAGKGTVIRPSQLTGTGLGLKMHPLKVKKLTRGKIKEKGVRLHLTPEELEINGEGLRSRLQSFYKRQIKPTASPLIKKAISTGIKAGLPALAVALGQPEMAPAAGVVGSVIADPIADRLQQQIGFGVSKKIAEESRGLKDDFSNILDPKNPNNKPIIVNDFSVPKDFKGVASTKGKRGKGVGSPTDPLLPKDLYVMPAFAKGGSFRAF